MRPGEIWLAKDGGPGPAAPRRGATDRASGLPCLNINISIEAALTEAIQTLSSGHRKSAFALKENVERLAKKYGVERIGFFTPTFAQNIQCPKEAGRRFNSLNTNVLARRYEETIAVLERMKSGRIHFHLLVVLPVDIRTGFNFAEAENGVYSSANKYLRGEWAFWRATAKKYGFGRCEMLPVKSTGEAIAKYVGKYIAKHIGARELRDKGVRLVRYSKGANYTGTRIQFVSPRSELWRHQVSLFAAKNGCGDIDALKEKFGARVFYWKREEICAMEPTNPLLCELWEADRIIMAARVSKAIGCTQAEAYVTLFQRGTSWGRSGSVSVDLPRYDPPPGIHAVDVRQAVCQTTVLADGTVSREWVR